MTTKTFTVDLDLTGTGFQYLGSLTCTDVNGATASADIVVHVRTGGASGTIVATFAVSDAGWSIVYTPAMPLYVGPDMYFDIVGGTPRVTAQVR